MDMVSRTVCFKIIRKRMKYSFVAIVDYFSVILTYRNSSPIKIHAFIPECATKLIQGVQAVL